MLTFGPENSLLWGTVLCLVGCLQHSWPVLTRCLHLVTIRNVSRYCQVFPGEQSLPSHPWERRTTLMKLSHTVIHTSAFLTFSPKGWRECSLAGWSHNFRSSLHALYTYSITLRLPTTGALSDPTFGKGCKTRDSRYFGV